jgi:hypothetical protein
MYVDVVSLCLLTQQDEILHMEDQGDLQEHDVQGWFTTGEPDPAALDLFFSESEESRVSEDIPPDEHPTDELIALVHGLDDSAQGQAEAFGAEPMLGAVHEPAPAASAAASSSTDWMTTPAGAPAESVAGERGSQGSQGTGSAAAGVYIPGGKISLYLVGTGLDIEVRCMHPGHGKCALTRRMTASTWKGREAQGRPLGLAMAFLACSAEKGLHTKIDHWRPENWPTRGERLRGRAALKALAATSPEAALLLASERPKRLEAGEESEPENAP